jgi:hypothetical protein
MSRPDPFTQGAKGSPGRPKEGRDIVTKTALAAELGVSRSRIGQLVARGLPVRWDGKLWRNQALEWVRANTVGKDRPQGLQDPVLDAKPTLAASATYGDARRVGEIYKAQRLHMAAEREKRSLLVRDEVESELLVQSRRIRDAWLNWPARVSAILAAAWGVDPTRVQVDLDREVRAQLAGLAEVSLGALR